MSLPVPTLCSKPVVVSTSSLMATIRTQTIHGPTSWMAIVIGAITWWPRWQEYFRQSVNVTQSTQCAKSVCSMYAVCNISLQVTLHFIYVHWLGTVHINHVVNAILSQQHTYTCTLHLISAVGKSTWVAVMTAYIAISLSSAAVFFTARYSRIHYGNLMCQACSGSPHYV